MSDPVRDHFFYMVGSACEDARLARLPVMAVTRDGRRLDGVPQPGAAPDSGDHEVDHTGFASEIVFDGERVALESIVELVIRLPAS